MQGEALFVCVGLKGFRQKAEIRYDVPLLQLELKGIVFQLGKVEHLIDETQQVAAIAVDELQAFPQVFPGFFFYLSGHP